ncbi:MAG: hypothetical protein QG657_3378 [Acidobacteriota bacterium]|nr:hypothetical protein [Acidobacteriota bacterium]
MKNKWLFLFLFLCTAVCIFPETPNPWGDLKKIHFYHSTNNPDKVLESLERLNCDGIDRKEKDKIAAELTRFGDSYFSPGENKTADYQKAEAFYRKALAISPSQWFLYNKLQEVERKTGGGFIRIKSAFLQLGLLLQNFNASFLLVNTFFSMLFFAGLLVFFIFSIVLFVKYFKLAGNDLLIDEHGAFSTKKAALLLILLLWPVVALTGWMIYPFLIVGLLWVYLNENEKRTILYFLGLIIILTLVYSFNLTLEKNAQGKNFKMIQEVYNGRLFDRQDYEKFDNDLKVVQAFSYYEKNEYDTALDILISTGDGFKNKLKFDLIGNIEYKDGRYSESIANYSESLRYDDKNPVTLNNFTLALLKDNKQDVFDSYAKRYPEIEEYRKNVSALKEIKQASPLFLWKRLLNPQSSRVEFSLVVKNVLAEFIQLPIIYYILLFVLYIIGMKKLPVHMGGSNYCSKCSKIIKEASVHKSQKLCDECYQLFMIKDVIFLEAKILKEKELAKKSRQKYIIRLIFSLFIPGLNLNPKENNRLFINMATLFYFLLGLAVIGGLTFSKLFSTAPLILYLVGMLAFILYFITNLISILGDYDGF